MTKAKRFLSKQLSGRVSSGQILSGRTDIKRTWWHSLQLLTVSLVLVQFQGNSTLIAKTLSSEEAASGDRPTAAQSPAGQSPQPEPIRIADEPVYIDHAPAAPTAATPEMSSGAIVVPTLPAVGNETSADGNAESASNDQTSPAEVSQAAVPPPEQTDMHSEPDPGSTYYADVPPSSSAPTVSNRPNPQFAQPNKPIGRRSQQELLSDYQNKIYNLVTNQGLKSTPENSDLRDQAKAETIATLEQLDGNRKAILLQFLAKSNLLDSDRPIISLVGADLSEATLNNVNLSNLDLRDANLSNAKLNRANLTGTKLFRANLNGADLSFANLSNAELFRANLSDAKLFFANLSGANLGGADLSGTDVSLANLMGADLSNATLKNTDLSFANLSNTKLLVASFTGAQLSFANLKGANIKEADLSNATLRNADLSNADLGGANLQGANLTNAKLNGANVSNATLNAAQLSNTTLPDGTVK
jgi:uncharacterized protein YjbI with pentapeptide repeats